MAGRRKKTTPEAPVETPAPAAVVDLTALFNNPVTLNGLVPTAAFAATEPAVAHLADARFNHVEGNIKGGVQTKLGPCTAIVSPHNRAGKTAVLDAFRFALTGTHPIGPHAADLTGLTADGNLPHATLQGGSFMSAYFTKGKKSVTHEVTGRLAVLSDEERKNLLPLSATRDLLSLGSAKAREALFARFGDGVKTAPEPVGLDAQQKALYQQALTQVSGDVVEKLAGAGTWIRSHKRTLSEQLKATEAEKERLHAELASAGAATDDVVRALEAKLEQWALYRSSAVVRGNFTQSESDLNAAIDAFTAFGPAPLSREEFAAHVEQLPLMRESREAHDEWKRLKESLEKESKRAKLLETILTLRKALGAQQPCFVCASQFHGDTSGIVRMAEEALAAEQSRLSELLSTVDAREKAAWEIAKGWEEQAKSAWAHWEERTRTYNQLGMRVKACMDAFNRDKATAENVGALEVPDEDEHTLRARLDAVKLAQARQDAVEEVSQRIRDLKDQQGDCKAVETVLEHLLSKLLDGVKEKAEEAVNRWMPEGFRAALCLESDDGKPECRWEVIGSDGKPHRKGALSGAEWAALSVAIACAWTEGMPYRYLLLDDADIAGFNPENLKATLNMVSKAVGEGRLTQALVAWSRPAEIPSEGWSVVVL